MLFQFATEPNVPDEQNPHHQRCENHASHRVPDTLYPYCPVTTAPI